VLRTATCIIIDIGAVRIEMLGVRPVEMLVWWMLK
jgi:hypothetical protein